MSAQGPHDLDRLQPAQPRLKSLDRARRARGRGRDRGRTPARCPGRSTLTATSCARSVVGGSRNGPGRSRRPRPAGRRTSEELADRPAELGLDRAPAPRRPGRAAGGPAARERSAVISSPTRSARVDSIWPSLMKVGPSSLSAGREPLARTPRPDAAARQEARRDRRKRNAAPTSASALSSARSAPWRARTRAMARSRRILRSDAAPHASRASDPPGGMERRDPAGQIAVAWRGRTRPPRSGAASSACAGNRRMLSTR